MKPMPSLTRAEIEAVLLHYDLGALAAPPESGSGTANANLRITTATGEYFLKRRNPTGVRVFLQRAQTRESRSRTPFRRSLGCYPDSRDSRYGLESFVAFDHALMAHMGRYGVKTPRPVATRDGRTWVRINDDVYEVFHYQRGGPHDRHSLPQIASAGRALADYHRAARDFDPPPGKDWPRYDDPRLIREGIAAIEPELKTALAAADFDYLMAQVALLERELPDERYHNLPKFVIHGDYHPGNMKFIGDEVAGIFDLDWATVQPRARDLADGIFLYAGEREGDINPADIFSLTQTWRPSIERGSVFMGAYLAAETVTPEEVDVLPLFVRARWLYCRVAGMVKVAPERRIEYFVGGLLQPLRAL
jgi:Ser/Thr protein kinase RdoA (MazF antagonist)